MMCCKGTGGEEGIHENVSENPSNDANGEFREEGKEKDEEKEEKKKKKEEKLEWELKARAALFLHTAGELIAIGFVMIHSYFRVKPPKPKELRDVIPILVISTIILYCLAFLLLLLNFLPVICITMASLFLFLSIILYFRVHREDEMYLLSAKSSRSSVSSPGRSALPAARASDSERSLADISDGEGYDDDDDDDDEGDGDDGAEEPSNFWSAGST